ncbi:MAG: MBL fold metallo-hydrolase [Acidobacteriota bacterium]
MKRIFLLFIAGVCLDFSGLSVSLAQRENATNASYRRALRIVENSFARMGGKSALAKVENIAFTLVGDLHARNQSVRPDTPFDTFPIATKVVIDLKKERVSWEQRNGLPGGIFFANHIVGSKENNFNLNLERKNYTPLPPNSPIVSLTTRLMPILFLQKALEQKANLRWLGEAIVDGKTHNLVSLVWSGANYTLYFDSTTNLLTKHETLVPDASVGDDWVEFFTTAYQNFDGLLLPTQYRQMRSGKLVRESLYIRITFNQQLDESLFKLPANYPALANPPFAVKNLAKDVYLAEGLAGGGYRSLFVTLNDGILVVDAPGNSQISMQVIREIKKAVPNKPIKHLVLTHFHDDHTGGIRPYIAEGAKILTTQRNRRFFEQMAKAEYTLAPDVFSSKPKNPDFMFIENQQTFSDGDHAVEIYNLNSPHAQDMYVVYLPKEKLLFQADLYNWATDATNEATVDMVEKIEKLGWQVETVIGSHSGSVPYQQIKDEVAAFRAKK